MHQHHDRIYNNRIYDEPGHCDAGIYMTQLENLISFFLFDWDLFYQVEECRYPLKQSSTRHSDMAASEAAISGRTDCSQFMFKHSLPAAS